MKYRGPILFFAGVLTSLGAGWFGFPRLLYRSSVQPVEFSHRTHTDKAGMKCEDCHALLADGRFSGIPPLEKCTECHAQPMGNTPEEKSFIEAYVFRNREVPWLVYARQPQNVYFPHAAHQKLGKLGCATCHGKHGESDRLRPYEENRISGYSRDIWGSSLARISFAGGRAGMKMSDCENCHRQRGREDGCLACHK